MAAGFIHLALMNYFPPARQQQLHRNGHNQFHREKLMAAGYFIHIRAFQHEYSPFCSCNNPIRTVKTNSAKEVEGPAMLSFMLYRVIPGVLMCHLSRVHITSPYFISISHCPLPAITPIGLINSSERS